MWSGIYNIYKKIFFWTMPMAWVTLGRTMKAMGMGGIPSFKVNLDNVENCTLFIYFFK